MHSIASPFQTIRWTLQGSRLHFAVLNSVRRTFRSSGEDIADMESKLSLSLGPAVAKNHTEPDPTRPVTPHPDLDEVSKMISRLRRKSEAARVQRQQAELELKQLREKIKKAWREVQELKSEPPAPSSDSNRPAPVAFVIATPSDAQTNLGDPPQEDGLSDPVGNQMRHLAVQGDSSSNASDEGFQRQIASSAIVKRKLKSGISAKSADNVRYPMVWPHAALQYEYASKDIAFTELTFQTLVAGELEIVLGRLTSKEEEDGRLSMLRKIAYYQSTFEWSALLKFYAAWLRQVELGQRNWSDDTNDLETHMLAPFVLQRRQRGFNSQTVSSGFEDAQNKVFYCARYQRRTCRQPRSHPSFVRGVPRQVQHICAACWLKDKVKLEHPECSPVCRHQTA